MDFLIAPRHRWIYVAIFGMMGLQMFYLFQQLNNLRVTSNPYWNLIFGLSKSIMYAHA